MKKKTIDQKQCTEASNAPQTDTGRGVIQDNFLAAIVTSKVYRSQIVRAKKGKGSYQRKPKHNTKGRESYRLAA